MNHGQEGQSLLLACVFLLVLSGGCFFLFDTGQLLAERIRLSAAADHTAYGVAVEEARLLNLNAYLNRAALANQLAVAQAVSVSSWAEFVQPLPATTAPLLAPPMTPVGVPVHAASQTLAAGLRFVPDLMMPLILQSQVANRLLEKHQRLLNDIYYPVLMHDSLTQSIKASGLQAEGVRAGYLATTDRLSRFVKRYEGVERTRFAAVLMDSRDAFTRSRKRMDEGLGLGEKCDRVFPGMPWYELKKRGGTGLLGLDEWKAMDTFSMHTYVGYWKFRRLRWKWVCSHSEFPIGYGSAAISPSGKDEDNRGAGNFDGSWAVNPSGSLSSRTLTPRFDVRQGGEALAPAVPEHADLTPERLAEPDPRLRVVIRLTKPLNKLPVTSKASALKAGSTLEMYEQLKGDELAALSKAEIYFQRPASGYLNNGKIEKPGLLNPYWRVRMTEPDRADRVATVMAIP